MDLLISFLVFFILMGSTMLMTLFIKWNCESNYQRRSRKEK